MSQDRLDRNSEGYSDPTAGEALKKVVQDERRTRPPIGVQPYYIAAQSRIKALAGAIQRYSHEKNGYKQIESWALEIVEQCALISNMNDKEAKR